ncbi:hypothetical protein KIOSHI_255 [Bacillus phage Kioshi]|nr:hypothetical protein KIOSHI_255 [Bacillus phage Kioshi]
MRRVRRRAVIKATRHKDFLYKDYKVTDWKEKLDKKETNVSPLLMLHLHNTLKQVQREIHKCIRESYKYRRNI